MALDRLSTPIAYCFSSFFLNHTVSHSTLPVAYRFEKWSHMAFLLLPKERIKATLMYLPFLKVRQFGDVNTVARELYISLVNLSSFSKTVPLGGTTVALPGRTVHGPQSITLCAVEDDGTYICPSRMGPQELWSPSLEVQDAMSRCTNPYWTIMQRDRRLSPSHARIRLDHSLEELDANTALDLLIRRGSRSGCILWLASVKSLVGCKDKQVQDKALLVEGIKGILGDTKVSIFFLLARSREAFPQSTRQCTRLAADDRP